MLIALQMLILQRPAPITPSPMLCAVPTMLGFQYPLLIFLLSMIYCPPIQECHIHPKQVRKQF